MTKVMYTGASGRMASSIRETLEGAFDSVRLFSRSEPERLFAGEELQLGELGDADAVRRACEDVDVIVHFAGIADESSFEAILSANIEGTYTLFEAAREAGVRRIVFASSNHVTGFYSSDETIDAHAAPRPDSYYGVSKVFGEALGRLYHDKWGMEVVSLRIGIFRPAPSDVRQLAMWLSPRDGAELVRCAATAPDVGYATVLGVSANTRSFWDVSDAAQAIGYVPQDDAESFADTIDLTEQPPRFQGGIYTDADYAGGSWVARGGHS
jgi:uronate dehydrogenase